MVFRRHCKAENRIAQLSSTTSPGYKKSPTGKLRDAIYEILYFFTCKLKNSTGSVTNFL